MTRPSLTRIEMSLLLLLKRKPLSGQREAEEKRSNNPFQDYPHEELMHVSYTHLHEKLF